MYPIDFCEHYPADYMATLCIGFLGWNTRFRGFESSFLLDHALVDIGVGVCWRRDVQEWKRLCCRAIRGAR